MHTKSYHVSTTMNDPKSAKLGFTLTPYKFAIGIGLDP